MTREGNRHLVRESKRAGARPHSGQVSRNCGQIKSDSAVKCVGFCTMEYSVPSIGFKDRYLRFDPVRLWLIMFLHHLKRWTALLIKRELPPKAFAKRCDRFCRSFGNHMDADSWIVG